MTLLNQPDKTTNRKVRWATAAAAVSAPLAYFFALVLVAALPVFQTSAGLQAMATLLEIGITTALTTGATWVTGYFIREEAP